MRLWCVVIWCGFVAPTVADEWPVARGPVPHEPNPYVYRVADGQALPKDFLDNATACYLHAQTSYRLEADGTTTSTTHEVIRLNSRKAIEELGEHRTMIYVPAYEKLTLHTARVHKTNSKIVEIEPKHVQLRDTATDFLVYAADKQLIISFPNLAVGDVLEVKWSVRGRNPEYQGHFFTRYGFGDERYPIARDVFQVILPKDRPLVHAVLNPQRGPADFKPIVQQGEHHTTYTWTANTCRPLPKEDHAPSREDARLMVGVSTMKSWDDVLAWKRQLRAKCWECTADLKQIVRDVTAGLKTPLEKAKALTYWVRREVRYVSAGEKHDYTPHMPATVVANRYGDCKDTSQLLAVLLKEAGLPVALVTLGVLGDGQIVKELPSPWGSHAILLVTLDGKDHWIDTTASLNAWDFLPVGDRDRLAYVIDDQGIRLLRTPALRADDLRIVQTTNVQFAANGDSTIERTTTSHGLAAIERRDDFVDVPSGERRRIVLSELQDANNKSRITALELDDKNLRDFDAAVTFRTVFKVPQHLTGSPVLEGSLSESTLWNRLLYINVDADRKQPLDLGVPFESIHKMVFTVPFGYRLTDPPSSLETKSVFGQFRRTVEQQDRRWVIEFRTRLERERVEATALDAFRQWQESIAKAYRVYVTMERVTQPDDARVDAAELAKIVAKDPTDAPHAALLIRLHALAGSDVDAGKVAELALQKNPRNRDLLEATAETARSADAAERAWQRLIEEYPTITKYQINLGRDLITYQRRAKARECLEPLTKNNDPRTRAEASYQMARLELAEEQAERARQAFTAATKADASVTNNEDADLLSAQIDEAAGQLRRSASTYRDVLQQNPRNGTTWRALIRVLLKDNQKSAAKEALREWQVRTRFTPEDHALAAEMYAQLDADGDALELAQQGFKSQRASLAYRVAGNIYAKRGDWSASLNALAKVIPADYDAPTFRSWSNAVLHTGELPRLSSGPGKLLSTVPSTAETIRLLKLLTRSQQLRNGLPKEQGEWVDRYVCAEALYQQGQRDAAMALLGKVLAHKNDFGPALGLRALLHLESGRLTKALADAEQAIKFAPDEALGHHVRGRIKLERSQPATNDLRKAVELSQQRDGPMLYWLAVVLAQEGRPNDARPLAEAALKLLPNDADTQELLKKLP